MDAARIWDGLLRWRGRSRHHRAMMVLAAVAVVSLLSGALQFVVLTRNEAQLVDRKSDSMWWVASQFRAEILLLHGAVAAFDGTPARRDDVQRHLDILYGRIGLINEGSLDPVPDRAMRGAIDDVIGDVERLGQQIATLLGAHASDMRSLFNELRVVDLAAGRMTTLAGQADAEHREAVRRAIWRANIVFGVAALLLVGSLLLSLRAADRQALGLDLARRRSERLSEDLAVALAQAQAGARAKNVFLATMSHEIRTPMNGVLGAASLLSHTALADDQRRWVEIVKACGEALLAQLDDVLDFSALEAAATRLQPEPFDIRALAEDTARVVENIANSQDLGLVVVVDPDVPATLVSDRRRLGQVMVNLLTNAVKFTPSGGVLLRLSLRQRGDTSWLRVAVVDSGPGIARSDRVMIFQEFTRLSQAPERSVRGTGLGLAISQRIATALGGRVRVAAAAGCGCVFLFTVPVGLREQDMQPRAVPPRAPPVPMGTAAVLGACVPVRGGIARLLAAEGWHLAPPGAPADVLMYHVGLAAQVAAGAAPRRIAFGAGTMLDAPLTAARLHAALAGGSANSTLPTLAAHPASRKLRLLVADDDAINRDIAASLLRHLGHHVVTVVDGRQALAAVQAESYHCVLLDLHMPWMDGAELARAIRALPRSGNAPRLVAVTADADVDTREMALAAGIDAVLTKPVTLERLADALRPLAGQADRAEPAAAAPVEPMRVALAQRLTPERLAGLVTTFWDGVARTLEAPDRLADGGLDRRMHTLAGSAASLGYVDVPLAARLVRNASRDGAPMFDAMALLYESLASALDADGSLMPVVTAERVARALADARADLTAEPGGPARMQPEPAGPGATGSRA